MSELLDVLDEHGTPTGRSVLRSEVHQKGLWHGTVHIYVYQLVDELVQILVHLRSVHKDLYPNTWDPVLGGHISAGHVPIQTVIEELRGEIGLSVLSDDLMVGPTVKADKGWDKEFNHLFLYSPPLDATLCFVDSEVQEARWMALDDVLSAIQTFPSEWRPTQEEFATGYRAVISMLRP